MTQPVASSATPTILIVDDDATTTRLLDAVLRGAGFETLCAYDLAGAEEMARTRPVSLILLDVFLPDGNGLDLCKRLMTETSLGIPILFISANDDTSVKVQGFAAGAVDYIAKPLAGAEILARVRTHLRLRAAYDALVALQLERIQRLAASQQSLMPTPGSIPGAGFQVCMRQALRAGGDFYDVVPSGNRITDYVVADASGHDLGVSLWTASFKTLLAEYASIIHAPSEIFRMINDSLRKVLPENGYFTALYARLNRAANKLTLVNAGHPAAILVPDASGEGRILYQEGDLIGIFPDAAFGLLEMPVRPGDRLFLYTDGLIEMEGSRDEGIDRLVAACQSTRSIPLEDAVQFIVGRLSCGVQPDDDIVLLGVEV